MMTRSKLNNMVQNHIKNDHFTGDLNEDVAFLMMSELNRQGITSAMMLDTVPGTMGQVVDKDQYNFYAVFLKIKIASNKTMCCCEVKL